MNDVIDLQGVRCLLNNMEGVVVNSLLEDGHAVHTAVAEPAVERVGVTVPFHVHHAAVRGLLHAVCPTGLIADF